MEKSDHPTYRTFETIKAEQRLIESTKDRLETKRELWTYAGFGALFLGPIFGAAAGMTTMAATKSQDLYLIVSMLVGGATASMSIPSFMAVRKIGKMTDRLNDTWRDLNKAALSMAAATHSPKAGPAQTARSPDKHAEKFPARGQSREQREENTTRTSQDDMAYLNTHLMIGAIAASPASNSPDASCTPAPAPTPSDSGSSSSSSSGSFSGYSSSYDGGSSGGGFSGGSDGGGGGGGCAFAPQML